MIMNTTATTPSMNETKEIRRQFFPTILFSGLGSWSQRKKIIIPMIMLKNDRR